MKSTASEPGLSLSYLKPKLARSATHKQKTESGTGTHAIAEVFSSGNGGILVVFCGKSGRFEEKFL